MTAEDKASPPRVQPIVLSPCLVVIGGLMLYGLTLDHWLTIRSMPMVAQVTGWDWHPLPLPWREEPMAPLFLAVTAPVRLLPAAWQPLALNIFTAVCAALTLGLLAASVRLMPHDRTRDQRLREISANGLLSVRAAFLPALFAVLMLAGQLTFWQNAVTATGEMLNLLVFAFLIYCLLRYRIIHNDKWLLLSAFVYGLGETNNWALLGFFPLYLIAVLWTKGFAGFFNKRFLWRIFLCGLAGYLLYFLVPLVGVVTGGGNFFYLLSHQFGVQRYSLVHMVPSWVVLLASVPALVPLIFAAIWWPSFEGEISPTGNALNRFMFQSLHLAFLALALVTFFDFKFSPSLRMREQPVSFLTFYYMAALCVGYFSGYILLVFGSGRIQSWERRHPLKKLFNLALVFLVWVVAAGGPALLAWQNLPRIRAGQSGVLEQFASQTLAGLPAKEAILLSDDPGRLYLVQAACERRGIPNKHILIDTASFPHREYIYYLVARHPELKSVFTTNLARLPRVLASDNLARFMTHVTQNFPVYYLHPSFGYYFEALYLKPHGVVYELKPFTTNMMQPPLVSEADVAANEAYWSKLENGLLKPLPARAELDPDTEAVSIDYGVALDYWGTELQKANHLKEAHAQFAQAIRLNTNNFIAKVNLEYNERLQKGDHQPIDVTDLFNRAVYFYHGVSPLLKYNGPPDEPCLDLQLGEIMAGNGDLRQASRLFERRLQLLPGDPETELAMAKTYVDLRQPAKALAVVRQLRGSTKISAWELTRCEALAYMASQDYSTAQKVLRDAIRLDPYDENRVAMLAEFYRVLALDELRRHKNSEAARHFADALTNINLQLQLLASSSHDAVATFDVPESLLKKAEVETMLQSYGAAAATLGQVLQLQPENYTALLNRALAEVQLKQFQAAKDDYKKLRKLLPHEMYMIDLGLADIAAAEKNTAEEIAQLKRVLKSAPEESAEYKAARQRLEKHQGH